MNLIRQLFTGITRIQAFNTQHLLKNVKVPATHAVICHPIIDSLLKPIYFPLSSTTPFQNLKKEKKKRLYRNDLSQFDL